MIKEKKGWTLLAFLFFFYFGTSQTFYFGADLSYINEMEDCGAAFNVDDIPTDPYEIFHNHGINLARFRIWHTPAWYDELNAGQRYSDFNDVRMSIIRAKSLDMEVLLNFHLSDTWADPSHQVAPIAWTNVLDDLPALQDSLYNYIFNALHLLAQDDLLPEVVQIGNETNKGILLSQATNDSGWVLDWDRNSALFNTAIEAIRAIEAEYNKPIKIALHIANPDDVAWYIGEFVGHNVVDFDVIGISYYYQWHQQLFAEVGEVITALREDYPDKQVMLFETAYPWTSVNTDGANNLLSVPYPGYSPFTPQRQLQWMTDLTQAVIDAGGSGVIYWEPGWVSTSCETQFAQGSSWDNATFFDSGYSVVENGGIQWAQHMYEFPVSVEGRPLDDWQVYQWGDKMVIHIGEEYAGDDIRIMITSVDGKIVDVGEFGGWEEKWVVDKSGWVTGYYFVFIMVDGVWCGKGGLAHY